MSFSLNDYQIHKIPIRTESFGVVFRDKRKSDGLDVCIKMSQKKLTPEEEQLAEREIQVFSVLKHPNIIQYYYHFYEEEHLCVVMELGDDKALSSLIGSPLHEKQVLQIFTQIVMGLNHMHQQKIAHQDLSQQIFF
jgi:serine/threonine protein kinase